MSTALPTGKVTFFFSDIEGSTKLVQRLGSGFGAVLEQHSDIVRAAAADADGIELGTEGDSFFLVFSTAPEAVAASVDVQCNLPAASWPDGGALRVRIGLHAGRRELGGANYVGLDVHRAARIAASGHGGQIVVSETVRSLAPSVEFIDFGLHRLKDLERPEHLHQVVIAGLPNAFPPLRSVDTRPNNLPTATNQLVGRQADLSRVVAALESHRLVTLTVTPGRGPSFRTRRLQLPPTAHHPASATDSRR